MLLRVWCSRCRLAPAWTDDPDGLLQSVCNRPFRCLALAKLGVVQSVTCREILDEFQEKLQDKFTYSAQRARVAVDEVRSFSRLVTISNILKRLSEKLVPLS